MHNNNNNNNNSFINNPIHPSLVIDTNGCGICPNTVHSIAYVSHYTLSILLTNTILVSEADICIINIHYK